MSRRKKQHVRGRKKHKELEKDFPLMKKGEKVGKDCAQKVDGKGKKVEPDTIGG